MKKERGNLATIEPMIHVIRGKKVILDSDLARVYGVATRRLNEQVRRNLAKFPPDFLFVLKANEVARLSWSQNATNSKKREGRPYSPFAFTEHGAIIPDFCQKIRLEPPIGEREAARPNSFRIWPALRGIPNFTVSGIV